MKKLIPIFLIAVFFIFTLSGSYYLYTRNERLENEKQSLLVENNELKSINNSLEVERNESNNQIFLLKQLLSQSQKQNESTENPDYAEQAQSAAQKFYDKLSKQDDINLRMGDSLVEISGSEWDGVFTFGYGGMGICENYYRNEEYLNTDPVDQLVQQRFTFLGEDVTLNAFKCLPSDTTYDVVYFEVVEDRLVTTSIMFSATKVEDVVLDTLINELSSMSFVSE